VRFENPSILYALFALLIPLLVHLFRFQRYKKIIFPDISLLENVERESRKSRVFRKWLIWFLRTGALVFLILAFAKPYLPAATNGPSGENYLIFDRSYSMSYRENNSSLKTALFREFLRMFAPDEHFRYLKDDGQW
jgi:hypothetical protein